MDNETFIESIDYYNILITPSSELFNKALVVMMSAILNSGKPCHFFIMQSDWTEQLKNEAEEFVSLYPENEITFIDVDDSVFGELPPWKGRYGTYYKMIAHLMLPKTLERVLYCDCDIAIMKNINRYYSMDFDNTFAICTNGINLYSHWKKRFESPYEMAESGGVTNLGVVLLNLSKLREENFSMDFYVEISKKFNGNHFAESGLLNYIFCLYFDSQKIKIVPAYKYNCVLCRAGDKNQIGSYAYVLSLSKKQKEIAVPAYWNEEYSEEETESIVHFCGPRINKPWQTIPDISAGGGIQGIKEIPFLYLTHLKKSQIERFYIKWWNIAIKLPTKYFYQLLIEGRDYAREVALKKVNNRLTWLRNAMNIYYEISIDSFETHKLERYIKFFSGKNISILKYKDRAGLILKKLMELYKINIIFSSDDKAKLTELTPEEFAECKKADVIISCCVHGTKTHERDGVKCIDIWDILHDESLTADLPPLNDKPVIRNSNEELKNQIADLQSKIEKASQQFSSNAIELACINEKMKQLETEMEKR